jgi:hypothetical protein
MFVCERITSIAIPMNEHNVTSQPFKKRRSALVQLHGILCAVSFTCSWTEALPRVSTAFEPRSKDKKAFQGS